MSAPDPKATLHRYLRAAREAVLWKLDGLGEYDIRRPLTPTGTNLLGLVKHLANVEAAYFGAVFGRPFGEPMAWDDGGEEFSSAVADLWATASESREQVTGLYRRASAHADATIDALPLDAPGRVPWWGERGEVTLHQMLVHVVAELNRHAGHADIVRELIDGATGLRPGSDNMAPGDAAAWAAHRDRLEHTARTAGAPRMEPG